MMDRVYGPPRPRPRIVLLSLEKQPYFDEQYYDLLTTLKVHADVEEVTQREHARAAFGFDGTPRPTAVLVTDAGLLSDHRPTPLVRDAATYARRGGTLAFVGHFSSFATPPGIANLFRAIGLPWESGDYHRTTFHVNPAMHHIGTSSLVHSYSQKALHLKNVAPEDVIYLSSADEPITVFGRPSFGRKDLSQSPAVIGSLGRGKVGYTGDVNAEAETTPVVLAMCGIPSR